MKITDLESGVFPDIEELNPHFSVGMPKLRYRLDTSLDNALLGYVHGLDVDMFLPFFPGLSMHGCGCGSRCGSQPTYHYEPSRSIVIAQDRIDIAHFLEHLVLDIQYGLGVADSISGVTLRSGGDTGEFTTVVESEDLDSCIFAVNAGLAMMHQALYTGAIDPRYGWILQLAKWLRRTGRTHVTAQDAERALHIDAPLASYCVAALRVLGFPVRVSHRDERPTLSQLGPVLVVEDDDDGRAILGETLTELGYQVRCAHDGRTGVDILKQFDTSAVVLDIYLPDVDGVSIARWLLESQPATKLVLISGGVDCGESEGLQNTEIRFLPKPFTIATLHTTLQATSMN